MLREMSSVHCLKQSWLDAGFQSQGCTEVAAAAHCHHLVAQCQMVVTEAAADAWRVPESSWVRNDRSRDRGNKDSQGWQTQKEGKRRQRAEKHSDWSAAATAIQRAHCHLLMALQLRHLAIREGSNSHQ